MTLKQQAWDDRAWEYILGNLRETKVQEELRAETAGLEQAVMQISPVQGQFMQMLVRIIGASKILEIGVFTGYSSLCMALALPEDGKIIGCDISEEYTSMARRYWKKAGVEGKIDLRLAPAAETLERLLERGEAGSFDMAFIDADKENYERYYALLMDLIRPGGLILIDNTLWSGKVADPSVTDPDTTAIRRLNAKIQMDPRVYISLLPIADGLTLVYKIPYA